MRKWVLIILLFIFMTPGVFAYLFYLHPEWLSAPATNRGQLIRPAVFVPGMFKFDDKWNIILWNPGKCLKNCEDKLDELMRVRLALGRRLYNVNVCLLQNSADSEFQNNICRLTAAENKLTELDLSHTTAEIFIVNPQKYWVLRYKNNAPLDDIYHDIKQLLN